MGFEPMRAFKPYLVSSEALSTTQPTLRTGFYILILNDHSAAFGGASSHVSSLFTLAGFSWLLHHDSFGIAKKQNIDIISIYG